MLMPPRQRRRGKRTPNEVSDSNNSTRSGRGRPMKRPGQLRPSRKARTLQANIIQQQLTAEVETPRKLSALEALPVEIIEQIFFHALELNLPRASVHLARALSRPPVYSALVLFAYFDASLTRRVEPRYFAPATFRPIELDDRIQLQEDILRTRWCTLEFLQSCLPVLTRLTMVTCWRLEKESGEETACGITTVNSDSHHDGLPPIEDASGMEHYFRPRSAMLPSAQQDEASTANAQHGYPPLIINGERCIRVKSLRPKAILRNTQPRSVLAAYVIPEQIVLRKPWTDTNIKLLQLLRQALRFWPCRDDMHCAVVPSPQSMFGGMANAIHEANELALLVLLEVYDTLVRRRYPDQPLPLRLFHQACSEPTLPVRLQCKMIGLLLRAAAEHVPADDEILTRWAIRVTSSSTAVEHDLSVARRVLKHMESRGAPNDPAGRALGPGGEPSFTEEIGYLQRDDRESPGAG
ncbi:hypothetical protein AYL99_10364 [Fonsecaea erecta]|uniref:Uncharacterized protein n=1 Tax=Fonsecaea erecta TaxID=1367422 RepID=A0A178Z7A9_9EURO|nr:hypothetical protein AYL99_10364 [Fonsecaea erecta]OAP55391.1 hypothetical protein AYL99_10364 [Fonsecaea erecta]